MPMRIAIDQSSIGKDFPALGPFKNFKPNLVGPGSAKLKFAIRIAQAIASKEGLAGLLAGTAIGTGVALSGEIQESRIGDNSQFNQAFRSIYQPANRVRSYQKRHSNQCRCQRCC